MALKATIFKTELSVADLDRNVYENFSLRLAQHPSENDARMMVRLLAFMLFADERLEFGKGLSTDDEPDLWLKDLTGAIDLWIYVGLLDERWLRKAAGRSARVVVIAYGDRAADVWWEQNRAKLEKLSNLTVYRLSVDDTQALAALANRSMDLQCTIQEGEVLVTGEGDPVRVAPTVVFGGS
ncbi:YaeQ family protein [Propionivibrio limicola]|uniref:YaeQ family protein n=1 Tax=Propionivibrio limicola TaxID=167645 RepID=UPI001291F866|nr:YaeQ family protein [Propionivibrio limicola]